MGNAARNARDGSGASPQIVADVVRSLDELRGENARLRAYVAGLEAAAAEFPEGGEWDSDAFGERNALALEVAELRARLAEAEQHLETIRQTFIYRIGEAIVSARTWKGLRRLPNRLLQLRRAFIEKRRAHQHGDADGAHFSSRLRYVDEALRVLMEKGLESATSYVRAIPSGRPKEKARALVELAHSVRHDAPHASVTLGLEAARLNPREPRLRPLILGLFAQGAVEGPARLLEATDASLMSSLADQRRRAVIQSHHRQLHSPKVFCRASAGHVGKPARLAVLCPRTAAPNEEALAWRVRSVAEAAHAAGLDPLLLIEHGGAVETAARYAFVLDGLAKTEMIALPPGAAFRDQVDQFIDEAAVALSAIIRERDVTHVHAMEDASLAAAALTAARGAGAKLIFDLAAHPMAILSDDEAPAGSERWRTRHALFTSVAAGADQVVARSRSLAHYLARECSTADALVVGDALPTNIRRSREQGEAAVRRDLGLDGARLIGMAEPLDADDEIAAFLEALPMVFRNAPDARALLFATGREARRLAHHAVRAGVEDRLVIVGDNNRLGVLEYMRACELCVFPRRSGCEFKLPAPFALQCALAAASPVVAADSALAREWIADGKTGYILSSNDSRSLAAAILDVFADPAQARRMANAGEALVAQRAGADVTNLQLARVWNGGTGRGAD